MENVVKQLYGIFFLVRIMVGLSLKYEWLEFLVVVLFILLLSGFVENHLETKKAGPWFE